MPLPSIENERRQYSRGTIITPNPPTIPTNVNLRNAITGNVGTQPTSNTQQSPGVTGGRTGSPGVIDTGSTYGSPGVSGGRTGSPSHGGGGGGGNRVPIIPAPQPTPTPTPTPQPTPQPITLTSQIPNRIARGTQDISPRQQYFGEIYTEPTLVKRQTGTIRDVETGQNIPTTDLFYVDPTGESLGGGVFVSTERRATREEQKYFESQPTESNIAIISPEKRTTIDVIQSKKRQILSGYQGAESRASDYLTSELNIGTDKQIDTYANIYSNISPLRFVPGGKEFVKSYVAETGQDIVKRPLANVATFGLGYGFGATKNALIIGAGRIAPKLEIASRTLIFGAEAGFGGLYAYRAIDEFGRAKDAKERGKIAGLTIKEGILFGAGYGAGYKSVSIVQGLIETKGKIEAPFEKLTTFDVYTSQKKFLELPPKEQLKAFEEARYAKAIGEPKGGFHTTPSRFSTDLIVEPKVGSSEFPYVLSIAPGISPAFAKIPGSSSGEFFPRIRDIFAPSSRPGIEFLKGFSFRRTGYRRVKPYEVEGQTFKYEFTTPGRYGYADLTYMKSEAEALVRKETGQFAFESGKYYTKIKGVRVPIDVFALQRPTTGFAGGGLKLETKGGKPFDIGFSSGNVKLEPIDIIKGKTKGRGGRRPREPRGSSLPRELSGAEKSLVSLPRVSPSSRSPIISRYTSSYSRSYLPYSVRPSSSVPSSPPPSSIRRLSGSSSILSRSSTSSRRTSSTSRPGSSYLTPPRLPILFGGTSKRKGQTFKQPTAYLPSFTALSLNIRSKKKDVLAGGLRVRAILD